LLRLLIFKHLTKNKLVKKKYFGLVFWLYILLILIVTVIPWSTSEKVGVGGFKFRIDYLLHLGAYFGLAFLFILWQINVLVNKHFFGIMLSLLICVGFAYSTEIIQLFVPGRTYNLNDFIANSAGITMAYLLFVVLKGRIKNSKLLLINI